MWNSVASADRIDGGIAVVVGIDAASVVASAASGNRSQ